MPEEVLPFSPVQSARKFSAVLGTTGGVVQLLSLENPSFAGRLREQGVFGRGLGSKLNSLSSYCLIVS